MKVRFFANTTTTRWRISHLPVRQTLVWVGPLFVLIQRSR